jgi:methyl-accepting chemotaxis protein
MDQVTQQNAALVEEAAAASESMLDQSQQLSRAVSEFKLSNGVVSATTQRAAPGTVVPTAPTGYSVKKPVGRGVATATSRPAMAIAPRTSSEDWEEF